MPNWCNNVVEMTHENNELLVAAKAAFDEGKFLQTLLPCPQELYDTIAGSFGDSDKQRELEEQQAANVQRYGYQDWYAWCIHNWGTKWDVGGRDGNSAYNDGTLVLDFESAWSPPIEAYEKLRELGYIITAYYYEPGCRFAGIYQDGKDTCFDGWEDAGADLPADLDQTFGISEQEEEQAAEEAAWRAETGIEDD